MGKKKHFKYQKTERHADGAIVYIRM